MKIDERAEGDISVIAIQGRIDTATASACEAGLAKLMRDGRRSMLLDLAKVDYLSSAGIRALVIVFKQAAATGVAMAVCRPQPQIVEILDIAGLTQLMIPHSTIEAAAAALR